MMGTGIASGPSRAVEAAKEAISSPLLDSISIEGAKALLVSIQSSPEMKFSEFTEAMETITNVVGEQANVFMGSSISEDMNDQLKVTVIATGFGEAYAPDPEDLDISLSDDFPFGADRTGEESLATPFVPQSENPRVTPSRKGLPPFLKRTID